MEPCQVTPEYPSYLSSFRKIGFPLLPWDVQHQICCRLHPKDLFRWEATCKTNISFCGKNDDVFQASYLTWMYGTETCVKVSRHRLSPLDKSSLQVDLQDELARLPTVNDLSFATSWRKLLGMLMNTEKNWDDNRFQQRVQIPQSVIETHPLWTFHLQAQHKLWVIHQKNEFSARRDEEICFSTLYNSETGETFSCNLRQNAVTDITISGRFLVVSLRNGVQMVWMLCNDSNVQSWNTLQASGPSPLFPQQDPDRIWSKIRNMDSDAPRDQDQRNTTVRYHGSIQMPPQFTLKTFESPYLMFVGINDTESFVEIWDVSTMKRVQSPKTFDGTTQFATIDSEYGMLYQAHPRQGQWIVVWDTHDLKSYKLPVLPATLIECFLLLRRSWNTLHHDKAGNFLFAINPSDVLVLVQPLDHYLRGEKTWQECAHFIEFSSRHHDVCVKSIKVANGRAVIALDFIVPYPCLSSSTIDFTFTSLFLIDLRLGRSNGGRIQILAPLAPLSDCIQMDLTCVYFNGHTGFYAEQNAGIIKLFIKFIHQHFRRAWPQGLCWKDSDGNVLHVALQHCQFDDDRPLEGEALFAISRFAQKWCRSNYGEGNAIFALDFSRPRRPHRSV